MSRRALSRAAVVVVSVILGGAAAVTTATAAATATAQVAPVAQSAAVAPLSVFVVAPCPQSRDVRWIVVNPNVNAVEASLTLTDTADPWARSLVLQPGATPVVVTVALDPAPSLVVAWRAADGALTSVRSAAAVALSPGTPQHTARCCGNPAELWLDKSAEPAEGTAVQPGDRVTWTLSVVGTGTVPRTTADVVDVVPAWVDVTDAGDAQVAPGGGVLTWRVSLLPGQRRDLRWTGTVRADVPRAEDGMTTDLVNIALVAASGLLDSTRHPVGGTDAPTPSPTGTSAPTSTATATSASSPTNESSATSAQPAAVASAGPPDPPRGTLSFTGAEVGALLAFAAAAVSAGVAVVWFARRVGRGLDATPVRGP